MAEVSSSPLGLPSVASLRRKLDQPCNVVRENAILRETMIELASNYDVQIWIDRRIDPSVLLTMKGDRQSLESSLQTTALACDAKVGWVENILYIGPANQIASIEAAYWRLYQSWPVALNKSSKTLEWNAFSDPRQILQRLLSEAEVQCNVDTRVDSDLWIAGSLRECSPSAKLTVLLAGFGLAAEFDKDKKSLVLVDLPLDISVQGKYSKTKLSNEQIAIWRKRWPGMKLVGKGSEWSISAPAEAHRELILPSVASIQPPETDINKKKVSGVVRGPLVSVLNSLKESNQLIIEPWPIPKEWQDRLLASRSE